jgi:ATP synthase protein I
VLILDIANMVFNYKKNKVWTESLHIVMQIGLTMAGCIVFCLFVGLYIDRWLGTKGVFVTIFILLGIIGGANTVYRQIIEITDVRQKDDDQTTNGSN